MFGKVRPQPVSWLFVATTAATFTLAILLALRAPLREAATIILFLPLIWAYMTRGLVGMIVVGFLAIAARILVEAMQPSTPSTIGRVIIESLFPILLYGALGVAFYIYRMRQAILLEQMMDLESRVAMGQLAGGLAHDFNNILTVIGGMAQLLEGDKSLSDQARTDVHAISEQSAQAADLVAQMRGLSRQTTIDVSAIDLNTVVRDQASVAQRLVPPGISVVTELAKRPLMVRLDAGQFRRVILNLCKNAGQAMPDGGTVTLATSVVERLGEKLASLSVIDTGVGMDKATQERAFSPFYTTRRSGGGMGLGLTIAQGIVKSHGGTMELRSEPGKGTTFTILLPLQDSQSSDEQPS